MVIICYSDTLSSRKSARNKGFSRQASAGIDFETGGELFFFGPFTRSKPVLQQTRRMAKRPTEIVPFGVLDIEAVLRFPAQASFQYPESLGFNPTEENAIGECVIAYGNWYE